jgi:hypothetical protein
VYNLLVSGGGWAQSQDKILRSRLFEHIDATIKAKFTSDSSIDLDSLCDLPTLLLEESHQLGGQIARVVRLTKARVVGDSIRVEYFPDPDAPSLTNDVIEGLAPDLEIDRFEFSRTHWAVKDVDLFRILLRIAAPCQC